MFSLHSLFIYLFFCLVEVFFDCVCVYRTHLPHHLPEKQWIYYIMNKIKLILWRLSLDLYLGFYCFFWWLEHENFTNDNCTVPLQVAELIYCTGFLFLRSLEHSTVVYNTIQKIKVYCLQTSPYACKFVCLIMIPFEWFWHFKMLSLLSSYLAIIKTL